MKLQYRVETRTVAHAVLKGEWMPVPEGGVIPCGSSAFGATIRIREAIDCDERSDFRLDGAFARCDRPGLHDGWHRGYVLDVAATWPVLSSQYRPGHRDDDARSTSEEMS